MKQYINNIIITITFCQIAQSLTHDTEAYRRIVRVLCALVLLLTVLSPLKGVMANIDRIRQFLTDMTAQVQYEEQSEKDPMEMSAQIMMHYAVEKCSLNEDGMKITLITDEEGNLTEVQLFVKGCAYADRVKSERMLEELYGIPVSIFSS